MTPRSFFSGLWRGLDGLRKVLHLIVLLALVAVVVGLLRAGVPRIPARAALLIAPQGELVEQLTGDPVTRAIQEARGEGHAETLLWDLTDSIRAAAGDRRIQALALDVEKFSGATQVSLEELAIAVREFRASGKKVIAYGTEFTEDREESRSYLNALWTSYQQAVTRARRLPADALSKYVATLAKTVPAAGGDAPQVALQAGLVTGIKSRLEAERRLIELVGQDDSSGSFKSVPAADYVRYARAEKKLRADGKPRVGVIVAAGEILDGDQPPGTVGGESTARLIRAARLDKDVKALVLRVDSPGGSVLASEQIYRELLALRAAGKPVVVSMSGYAASGGYYISAPADEIWASPATLTGSIGIFAIIPTVERTLGKIGVSVDGVGTTPLSGQLRIDRPLGEEARALLQSQINRGYDEFLARVASGRNKTHEQVDAIAQ